MAVEPLETRSLLSSIIYVDLNSAGPNHNGGTWAAAYEDLQQALGDASEGDEIRVADGIYYPSADGNRSDTFQLLDDLRLLGSYAGDGAPFPNARDTTAHPSILSGDIGAANDTSDNSYHVVTGSGTDATAVLDGFRVTDGNANLYPTAFDGGGIFNYGGSPTISNCNITDNNAASSGGGIANDASSSPVVNNCTFINNRAGWGGGMYNETSSPAVANCSFVGNSAERGGGTSNFYSSPTFTACNFNGNDTGGGLYNYQSAPEVVFCAFSGNLGLGMRNDNASSPTVSDCSFTANTSGGMANSYSSSPTLNRCTFTGNSVTGDSRSAGGGMSNYSYSSPTLNQCIFSGNSVSSSGADAEGGAMANYYHSAPTMINSTFTRNYAYSRGGAVYSDTSLPEFSNCIFNGNTAHEGGAIYGIDSSYNLTNCKLCGNSASGGAGGGACFTGFSVAVLTNCTFTKNSASSGGAIFNSSFYGPTLANSILWDNSAGTGEEIFDYGSATDVTHSDVQGAVWPGAGNISADPQFYKIPAPGNDNAWGTFDDDYGNLRPLASSPCIDDGDNSAVPGGVTLDLAKHPRVQDFPGVHDPGEIVDMGAYERDVPGYIISTWGMYRDAGQFTFGPVFSDPIDYSTLTAADLVLMNLTTGQPIDCGASSTLSVPSSTTALWAFDVPLPDGNYRATLRADSLTNVDGEPLGQDCTFDFFYLPGDANSDRTVDTVDFNFLVANFSKGGQHWSSGDFDYSGTVDTVDFNLLASRFATGIAPASTVPMDAETTTPLRAPASGSGSELFGFSPIRASRDPLEMLASDDRSI